MNWEHQPESIICNRYRVIDVLGRGSSGITYRVEDLNTKQEIALKALSLDLLKDWKQIELFKQEAEVLSKLNHPAIPRYLDYFQIDTPDNRAFYLAQVLAPGKSLSACVESGWRTKKREVKGIAEQILSVLTYLHTLKPPVIHRDIKPQNIIRSKDGKIYLVDFGAVQNTYHNILMQGNTVVETYGYMAPEQFRGGAVLATDLYGLGCVLLFLLTRKSPAELTQKHLKFDYRSEIKIERNFARWLDKLIAPDISDRFPTAEDALKVLRDRDLIANYQNLSCNKPEYSKIKLTYYQKKLIINLPPALLSRGKRLDYFLLIAWNLVVLINAMLLIVCVHPLGLIPFALFAFLTFVSPNILSYIFYILQAIAFALLFWFYLSYLPWGISSAISWLVIFIQFCLNFKLQYKLTREIQYPTKVECSQYKITVKRKATDFWSIDTIVDLKQKAMPKEYRFGRYLTKAEQRWLVKEIDKYIQLDCCFDVMSDRERLFSTI